MHRRRLQRSIFHQKCKLRRSQCSIFHRAGLGSVGCAFVWTKCEPQILTDILNKFAECIDYETAFALPTNWMNVLEHWMTCAKWSEMYICVFIPVRSLLIIIITIVAKPVSPDLLERMIASAFNRLRFPMQSQSRLRRHTHTHESHKWLLCGILLMHLMQMAINKCTFGDFAVWFAWTKSTTGHTLTSTREREILYFFATNCELVVK